MTAMADPSDVGRIPAALDPRPRLYFVLEVPAAGFEPAHFGLKELARLSVWPELGYPARSDPKLIGCGSARVTPKSGYFGCEDWDHQMSIKTAGTPAVEPSSRLRAPAGPARARCSGRRNAPVGRLSNQSTGGASCTRYALRPPSHPVRKARWPLLAHVTVLTRYWAGWRGRRGEPARTRRAGETAGGERPRADTPDVPGPPGPACAQGGQAGGGSGRGRSGAHARPDHTRPLTTIFGQIEVERLDYLTNKRAYLAYNYALQQGWPIATGVIEGACRHLVEDRMGITGARWSLAGAEAVLRLRALIANGHFDAYWAFHLEREHQRIHRARYAPARTHHLALAA